MTDIGNLSERYEVELEAHGTASPNMGLTSALGIVLLIATFQGSSAAFEKLDDISIMQEHATQGSSWEFEDHVSAEHVMAEIDHVYSQLLSQQVELESLRKVSYVAIR